MLSAFRRHNSHKNSICVTGTNIIQSVLLHLHQSTDSVYTCSTKYMEQQTGETEMQSTAAVQTRQISQSPVNKQTQGKQVH